MVHHRRPFVLGFVLASAIGLSGASAVADAFPDVRKLETELARGVSTKLEVRNVLGTPDGNGTAMLPPEYRPQDVWYYEDVMVTDIRSDGEALRLNMRQRILLIFFDGITFNGFTWSSNVLLGERQ